MDEREILAVAVDIARQAGAYLRTGFLQPKQVRTKSSAIDWVTEYDTAAEAMIVARLRAAFPHHAIVAEEGGGRAAPGDYCWHVDPLDGTINYAHNFPHFCVSLALARGDQPILGVIYDPCRDECFTAAAGQGAFLTQGDAVRRLAVTVETELAHSLLATGFPYDRQTSEQDNVSQTRAFLKKAHGVRRAGAAALDTAYVAAGRLDGYWEFKLRSWDIAAGALLVREAGGAATMIDGRPFALADGPMSVVMSNGHIQQQMLDVLDAARSSDKMGLS